MHNYPIDWRAGQARPSPLAYARGRPSGDRRRRNRASEVELGLSSGGSSNEVANYS